MRTLGLMIGAMVLACIAMAGEPPPLRIIKPANDSEKALLSRVRAVLPDGWTADYTTYGDEAHFLDINHTGPEWLVSTAPNQSIEPYKDKRPYMLSLQVVPLITKQEYHRLDNANKATNKKVSVFFEHFSYLRIPRKSDDFYSEQPEEKKADCRVSSPSEIGSSTPRFLFSRHQFKLDLA